MTSTNYSELKKEEDNSFLDSLAALHNLLKHDLSIFFRTRRVIYSRRLIPR